MRVLACSQCCAEDNRGQLTVTFKAHANTQSHLIDLRKNLNDKKLLREYVQKVLGDEKYMSSILNTISSNEKEEHRLATVTGWSTVNIASCAGISNASIYAALQWVMMPLKVEIFNFKRSGPEDKMARGQFLVDNLLSANRLKRLQGEVAILYTCQKFELRVTPGLPKSVINASITEDFTIALEAAIKKRYNLATRTLDLSRFHAVPELALHFCPLHVTKLLENVLVISNQIFPQMAGIVLSNNYLCTLKAFAGVSRNFANLDRLDVSANKINDLEELNYLKNLNFKTLFLAGTGLAKKNVVDIQKVLPQLQNVHGCLPFEEHFIVVDNLPKYQRLQSGKNKGLQFCQRFITSYYNLFDDLAQREQLSKYYYEWAMFSLSVPVELDNVNAYKLYNRNKKSHQSSFAHNAKLQLGNAALLLAISRLPLMCTDYQNAGLDIEAFTSNLCIFTLTGFFKEITSDGWEPRHFQRTFVMRLLNRPGWLITNDMLCIMSANSSQKQLVKCNPEVKKINTVSSSNQPSLVDIKTKEKKKNKNLCEATTNELAPLNQAIENMNLSTSNVVLSSENFNDMPPLVAIGPLITNPPSSLGKEIADTLTLSEEDDFDLVIDEDVFLGGDDF
ncbi:nuclear RNA export factor 1 [Drosophila eugracilis]|uniref:nuclear RNA export factor 1 n=1 Tax=Drosophila eugracilis TaxID=29029 RepID=UPI0007E88A9E|nr:nuclear RNA export factor 1 [Drosophila eugracilis]